MHTTACCPGQRPRSLLPCLPPPFRLPVIRGSVMPVSHSLPWAIRQCGSGRRRADVLSIPPARRQRHSTWPPCVLLTLVMGTAILSIMSGLLTPVGNDWQVSIPETGLLQRSTTCARCPAPAEQMTKTRYYIQHSSFRPPALAGLGQQLATPDGNYHVQVRDLRGISVFAVCACPDHLVPLQVAQALALAILQNTEVTHTQTPQESGLPAGSCACLQRTGTDLAWVQCATFAVCGIPCIGFRKSAHCIGRQAGA